MTSQTKDRKAYESPLSELIYILPEGVICNGSGTGGEVTIEYANTETSVKKPANVYINCGGNTIAKLNVNLSESHVEISGKEGSNATIGTVTSKTSENTLVLQKTVTIGEKLTVAAGSVEVAGTVKDIEVENTVDEAITVKVTKDATVSGKLSVAKAASVEVAAKVSTVEVTAAVPQVTIAAEVATVTVNVAEGSATETAPVIWVTESGKVTEAVKDATATTSGTANVAVVAANGQADGTGDSVKDGQVAKVMTVTDGTTETTVSNAVKKTTDYLVAGGEVTLGEDLKGYFTISADVTINLNGKTISTPETGDAAPIFTVAEGASFTINGEGNITNTATGKPAIVNNGTLVIKGGTYGAEGENLIENNGTLSISGGAFSSPISNSDSGNVSITGGIYTDAALDESFLADGYSFAKNTADTKADYPWKAVNGVVMLGDDAGYYANLAAAINAAGSTETTITILRNMKITSSVYVNSGKKIIINTNKKTIDPTGCRALVVNGGELTVNGGGKFIATNSTGDNNAILNLYSGKLTVGDVYIEGANVCVAVAGGYAVINDAEMKAINGGCCVLCNDESGVVDIRGISFSCAGDDPDGPSACVASDGGTINIWDGTFEAAPLNNKTHEYEVLNANYCLFDWAAYEIHGYTRGYINVYGGSFKDFNPAADNQNGHSLVADGYQSVYDEATETWTVSKK